MLPTNPQSMSTADKSILENLREQGAQIDRQARVMEKLVDRIARMMTAEERVEKKTKKKDNKIEGDTKIKDVPGLLIDKLADKLDDSITKQFLKIKDSFKKEKQVSVQEPVDRSQEPSLDKKEKKPKDETDTLRTILNSMIGNSKYQEQMTENSKALQSIADKTLTNVDNLNDNLKNIEQPEANKTEEKNNKKEGKLNNNQKLAIAIGVSIAAALKPQFDTLGKTLKDALERGFAELTTALDNISGNTGGFGVDLPLGGPDGKDGKGKGGKGGLLDKAGEILKGPGLRRFVPLGLAAGLYTAAENQKPEIDKEIEAYQNEKAEKEAAAKQTGSRKAEGKLKTNKQKYTEVPEGEIVPYEGKDYKKQADGSLADNKGNVLSPNIQKDVESVYLDHLNKKGMSSVDFNNEMNSKMDQLLNLTPNNKEKSINRSLAEKTQKENINIDQMKNNSRAAAVAIPAEKQKEKERLERLKTAESIDPKALEWAKKYYKNPNLSDPEYLSQDIGKNKSILEFLQKGKNQDHIKQNPNWLLPEAETKKKPSPPVKQQKNDKMGMLNKVTDTNMALAENKNTQPIVITNNTTNTGGGSDPAPIAFGSASPRNTSTAINDYFRNNGRLHDAAYG